MTHNNPKIQEKFYPLQHEEWLRACKKKNWLSKCFELKPVSQINTVTFEEVES